MSELFSSVVGEVMVGFVVAWRVGFLANRFLILRALDFVFSRHGCGEGWVLRVIAANWRFLQVVHTPVTLCCSGSEVGVMH